MIWSLYALLSDDSPPVTIDALEAQLASFFQGDSALSIERERVPFSKGDSLLLRWGKWGLRINYEEGADVEEDSVEISKRVGDTAPFDLSDISRRIRMVAGTDADREYTNETIEVIDFLRNIPGIVIFDPQQNNILAL
jgi:hypothetical protein